MNKDATDFSAAAQVLSGLKAARAGVSVGTAALLRGAAALGSAVLEDARTVLAKVPGSLFDYSKASAYSGSARQLETFFNMVEDHTGKSFPNAQEKLTGFFANFMGLSPKDTLIMTSALCGAGVFGRAVKDGSDFLQINDMAEMLAEHVPNLPVEPASIVIGVFAITAATACKVWINLRGMQGAADFEKTRGQEVEALKALEAAVQKSDFTDQALVRELKAQADKFKSKFDENKKLSPETVGAIKEMRANGSTEVQIESRIAESPDEYRGMKKIYSSLADDYNFAAPKAAQVAHDLIINGEGDLPLIRSKLGSREIPKDWIEDFGFDPRYAVGEVKIKDRPSELLRLGVECTSMASELLNATADRIKEFYAARALEAKQGTEDGQRSAIDEPKQGGMRN